MATPAQLYQDALNIVNDAFSRLQNDSYNDKDLLMDLALSVQMVCQAGLSASPSTLVVDPSDSTNVATTAPATEPSP